MTTNESLIILGLTLPRFRAKSQEDADKKIEGWKQGALKQAWREIAKRNHPDTGGSDATFARSKAAYDHLQSLRANFLPPQTPEQAVVRCLLQAGIVEKMISTMRESGELTIVVEMGMASDAFTERVHILLQRQRLGLFGPYSGWNPL